MQLSVRSKFPNSALWGLQHMEDGNVSTWRQEGRNGTYGHESLRLPVVLTSSMSHGLNSTIIQL